MNAVEIEAALSDLAIEPFDATEFPFQFLAAFGNKDNALGMRTMQERAYDTHFRKREKVISRMWSTSALRN